LLTFNRPGAREKSGGFHSLLFLPIVFVSVLSSCSGLEKFDKRELVIEGREGNVVVMAEIARTDAQRKQGLMHRKELKDGDAMLFIFERDQILSFWMKNTLIPLSVAYIAQDGRILEIYDMEPGNLSAVNSSRSARYALEVPQGWFSRAGIGIGDKLDIKGF
jgi:uncharacterized membrane protein (UPF0127 family)